MLPEHDTRDGQCRARENASELITGVVCPACYREAMEQEGPGGPGGIGFASDAVWQQNLARGGTWATRNERDVVTGKKHYHEHPSGVECWQIVERHSFNIGNAIKYIWRLGKKETPVKEDLGKALNYVNRELGRGDAVKIPDVGADYETLARQVLEHLNTDDPAEDAMAWLIAAPFNNLGQGGYLRWLRGAQQSLKTAVGDGL